MDSRQQLDRAWPAVAAACRLTRRVQGRVGALDKADGSPVTLADFGAQALVLRALGEAFPEDGIFAEESAAALYEDRRLLAELLKLVREELPEATAEQVCRWIDSARPAGGPRWWLLDPLDGTKGLLAGGQFAVALALIEEGRPTAALLGCPNAEPGPRIYGATVGRAWRYEPDGEERPVHVNRVDDPAQARALESRVGAHSDLSAQHEIYRLAGLQAEPGQLDSQAKYALVAAGEAEVYLRLPHPDHPGYVERAWDHAAGALLVCAAGGRVTDMTGAPLDFGDGPALSRNRGVLATCGGPLHDRLLDAIARVLP